MGRRVTEGLAHVFLVDACPLAAGLGSVESGDHCYRVLPVHRDLRVRGGQSEALSRRQAQVFRDCLAWASDGGRFEDVGRGDVS